MRELKFPISGDFNYRKSIPGFHDKKNSQFSQSKSCQNRNSYKNERLQTNPILSTPTLVFWGIKSPKPNTLIKLVRVIGLFRHHNSLPLDNNNNKSIRNCGKGKKSPPHSGNLNYRRGAAQWRSMLRSKAKQNISEMLSFLLE